MKPTSPRMRGDTQDNLPSVQEDLERVGITNLKTLVVTNWKGKDYKFIPEIELTIDLDKERKGVHMSRLIESITEMVEEEIKVKYRSLEELEKHILESIKKRHEYRKAEISMRSQLIVEKRTPITKKQTFETYDFEVSLRSSEDMVKALRVDVVGATACPHALKSGKTHMQRAVGTLELTTEYENKIELEDMIKCVEESFSSPVYTLLKTEDERFLIDDMIAHPKFVEDVTREILHTAKTRFKRCEIFARTLSYESIHRHDVLAEGRCRS